VYDVIAFYCLKSDQIVDKASSLALVVDPLEPETVLKEIENQSVSLQGVLTTHHHW
jgi:hydroxyacylglutathione hydrolase